MTDLVVAPLAVALVTAIGTLAARRTPRLQRVLSMGGGVGYVAAVAALAWAVLQPGGGTLVYQVGGWPAPFGITLVADGLSAFVLALSAVVGIAALAYSMESIEAMGQQVAYHPLFHFVLVGVAGATLTGDLFNLFVWFEVMLMPSYVLVVFLGGDDQTAAAIRYTALNLVGSAVMLVAVGGIYATTGTLNMADLARRLAEPAAYGIDPAPVVGLSALLVAVFALKAGLTPFQFWVPSAYRAAPAPATAMLAGVTKKVGVYAMIRLLFTVLGGATLPGALALPGFSGQSVLGFFGPVLFVLATVSILYGGLAAASRPDLDGVLAYSSIGQVGFIVLPLAVAATATDPTIRTLGVAAALVYSLNHALAKSLLFMVSGLLTEALGTDRLSEWGGLAKAQPVVAGAFFVGALALAGIPPLAGFFGKLLVFDTAARATGPPGAWLALAVALVGAVLTIGYTGRAWNRGFWGEASELAMAIDPPRVLVGVVVALAIALVVVGVWIDPVLSFATAGADAALDGAGYAEAVLGGEPP